MVSLTAEVGINYLEARSLQRRLAIAEDALSTQKQSYDIARWRREAGLVTQLDEDQAISAYQQTKAQIPSLEATLEQNLNRIAVLLGENPGSVHALMGKNMELPAPPGGVAVGIPADLLRRRPDIRRAERNLAAATARIGVATAAQYPSFPLTGSLGLEALSTGGLFTANARTWAMALSPVLTLFDAGRNRANVDAATAQQEQALAAYESTLLSALSDVENALSAYSREQRRLESLLAAEAATLSAFKLASDQYSSGLADFLAVLDAQRNLLTIQDLRAVSELSVLTDLVRLYKALGGGWDISKDKERS
jgi:NodT family efflux transporter outer membrane factor (OMF) lipoprotein